MKIHSSIYSPSHVIALHKKGLTNKAIAIRTGLSMERIRRIVNKHKQEQQQEKGDNGKIRVRKVLADLAEVEEEADRA